MLQTRLNDRFLLQAELGRGGMGAVYRALDEVLGRTVAIKVLNAPADDAVTREVRREAQVLARLLHDNVVRLYDIGETESSCYLVMEEVRGSTFQRRWPELELDTRLETLAKVAEALDYAHRQGVVHRDVKPANILMTEDGRPKLSDFGLSMAAEHTQQSGVICGTPHYMSPEQARGRRLDHRTDLYSLGVILYECATGRTPFRGSVVSILGQHAGTEPATPRRVNPDVSEALERLILDLMAKEPAARPRSGRHVAQALRDLVRTGRHRSETAVAPGEAPTEAFAPAATLHTATTPRDAASPIGPTLAQSSAELATAEAGTPLRGLRLAGAMIDAVEAEPLPLSVEQRYLCGHYLAYLLGRSRRQGLLGLVGRRPLDGRNADRARLLLAMTWLTAAGVSDETVARAASLLDDRPDVRPALSPTVVAKYLACRDTPAKRAAYRDARRALHQASAYAQAHMTDEKGNLNPGLMPRTLADLRKVAPAGEDLDVGLLGRWMRVAEVWRVDTAFRQAVLRYATRRGHRDPASAGLWPEVVYPLLERARWQRRLRSRTEAAWEAVCKHLLHVPAVGLRLDRAIQAAFPESLRAQLELSFGEIAEDAGSESGNAIEPGGETSRRGPAEPLPFTPEEEHDGRGLVPLASPDPIRMLRGELRALWEEAVAALRARRGASIHRAVPLGPYRLAVLPSLRGHLAGKVAIQDIPNKQIELITPSFFGGGSPSTPVVATWVYRDGSLLVAHLDFHGNPAYVLWNAPNRQQENFETTAEVNHALFQLGFEVPDHVDRALSKRFRPPATANA